MNESNLFSPFQLKKYTLKNRIGVAPMTRMSSEKDSIPRQDVLDFLVTRARGGAALVYTEAFVTDYESSQGYPGQARLLTQRQIDAWKPVVEAIQKEGSQAIAQVFHCGRISWPEVNPAGRTLAPSAVTPKQNNPMTGKPYTVPDVMSEFDIEHVINGFRETAKGVCAAGFDGFEIHGAHGYLVNEFLSPYTNQRTDAYGGSAENRFRFAKKVIQAVASVWPKDRLLTFRISNWGVADMEVPLFESREDYQAIIRLLSAEPLDAISVSTYAYHDKAFGTEFNMAQITRQATSLPIMICGQIHDRKSAEDALKDADIILSAKSMLLNPDWVAGLREGRALPLYKSAEANIAYTKQPLP